MSVKPIRFKDLDTAELYRSAVEDFAIEITEDEKGSKTALLAALTEAKIAWQDYVAQHPEVLPDKEKEPVNVLKTSDMEKEPVAVVVEEAPTVHVQSELPKASSDLWLVKMVRDNPVYQTCGHTFTQKNPYALLNSNDANYVLSREVGFRQATPAELEEYYS